MIETIPTGYGPGASHYNLNTNKIYCNHGSNSPRTAKVLAIDGETDQIIADI